MSAADRDRRPEIRQGDLWAWMVSFLVTLGLHIGIVLFAVLAIALFIYAIASVSAGVLTGISIILWSSTVVSLFIWAFLVEQQARRLHPHAIRGLGRVIVATSGCEMGEIAADLGAGLLGLAYITPLLWPSLSGERAPDRLAVTAALVGGLFVAVGWGSLGLRLWLHHRRARSTHQEQAP